MLRTALLSALLLLCGLPAVASAASVSVTGGVLTAQLAAPGSLGATLEAAPCSEPVHTTLEARSTVITDPAGCVEVRTEAEDVAPGPGCAYASAAFKPFTTIAVCGLSGVTEVVVSGTPGPDMLTVNAHGPHAQVLRANGAAGADRLFLNGAAPQGAPLDPAQTVGLVPTGAGFVDGGEGDDTLGTDTPAVATLACGGGNDTVERSKEQHVIGADCEHFKGLAPTVRPATLPGRVGMADGALVVDASRYTGSKALGLTLSFDGYAGRPGWRIAEDPRSSALAESPPKAVALATGPGCQALAAEDGRAQHFCPASPATPLTVRGPQTRQLVTDFEGESVTAPVTVTGGRDADLIAYASPLRMKVFCGPGLDTVLAGWTASRLESRPALGVNAWAAGDCEMPRGVRTVGKPAPVKVKRTARGVVGDRGTFPLTGIGAIVTVTCPPGGLSCGGKMDMHLAGEGCGYLGTIPWTADAGRTARIELQFGTIEGELRCGSLLDPRRRIATKLRKREPAKVVVVTRLGKSSKRSHVTLRR